MHFLIKDLQILDMRHGLANTSSQAKDTNTTSLRTLGRSHFLKKSKLPLRHFIGYDQNPSRPIKPSVSRNLPQNRKQKWRRPSKT